MKPKLHAEPSGGFPAETRRSARSPDYDEDDDNLAPLSKAAALVRRIYIEERTRYEHRRHGAAGTYHPPKDWDGRSAQYLEDGPRVQKGRRAVWEDLAETLLHHRIEPHAYMSAIFGDLSINERPPNPDVLRGEKCLARWDEIRAGKEKEVELSLRLETQRASQKMAYYQRVMSFTAKRAHRTTLVDDSLPLSPLFRYCVAYDMRYDDIAEHYFAQAVQQFMRYEDFYLKHWKRILPKRFAEKAKRAYRQLTGVDDGEG